MGIGTGSRMTSEWTRGVWQGGTGMQDDGRGGEQVDSEGKRGGRGRKAGAGLGGGGRETASCWVVVVDM
jgi:hypothetical protein